MMYDEDIGSGSDSSCSSSGSDIPTVTPHSYSTPFAETEYCASCGEALDWQGNCPKCKISLGKHGI